MKNDKKITIITICWDIKTIIEEEKIFYIYSKE